MPSEPKCARCGGPTKTQDAWIDSGNHRWEADCIDHLKAVAIENHQQSQKMRLALENVLMMARRENRKAKTEAWVHIIRFCAEVGVKPDGILRGDKPATGDEQVSEPLYYIQNRGHCGDCLLWWKDGGHGYATDLAQAWKVTRERGEKLLRPHEDRLWPVAKVDAAAARHLNSESDYARTVLAQRLFLVPAQGPKQRVRRRKDQ